MVYLVTSPMKGGILTKAFVDRVEAVDWYNASVEVYGVERVTLEQVGSK